jgi:hypothetical protein
MNADERKNRAGGSAGAGGYDFQAEVFALLAAKLLAREPLNWVDVEGQRIPEAIYVETGTGGDDLRILLSDNVVVELQSKRGVERSDDLWTALIALAKAIEADARVYGVLLTNTRASGPVRIQLKDGIERVGQQRTDDLPDIVNDLLCRFKDAGIKDVNACCRRLRIIIRDLEPGSAGEEETLASLRKVVADEDSAGGARNTLVSDGHDVMQIRGRREASDLARKLRQSGIKLSPSATNPLVMRESFLEWSSRSNETFIISGLGVALSMDCAWVKLRAMDSEKDPAKPKTLGQQINEYLEWHRLAETSEPSNTFDVEAAARRERFLVIVAGPGAGKSTLLRRLARAFSLQGRPALRVPLRAIAARLRKGEPFDDALLATVSADGFPKDRLADALLGAEACLLADGLDEADPDRAIVAENLRNWALSDPSRQVIIATRPVGHDPAWFDGWKHFELLPLGRKDIEAFAHTIYTKLFPDNEKLADEHAKTFLSEVARSRTASIASRNPQLLGILITLHVNGSDISGKRYALFDKAIEHIRQQRSADRVFRHELEAPVARRSLECIGWELLNNPTSARSDLIRKVGSRLGIEMGQPALAGEQNAEKALEFWEERGLLEHLSSAGESASVFIHLTFRDQTAATYLSKLSNEEVARWVSSTSTLPQYREALLLAAGTGKLSLVINTLLEMDNPCDPISTAALLAADALGEAEAPSADLRQRVIDHLLPRVASQVPLVAYESGEKLRALTLLAPSVIGPVALKLAQHEHRWVREVACTLGLLAGNEYVDAEALLAIYPTATDSGMKRGRGRGIILDHKPLITELLLKGADYLLRDDAPPLHVEVVKKKYEDGHFSSGAHDQLWSKLAKKLPRAELPVNRLIESALSYNWKTLRDNTHKSYAVIIEIILAACGAPAHISSTERPDAQRNSLLRLWQVLDIGKTSTDELMELISKPSQEHLVEVIRGTIHAARLDPAQVFAEARELRLELEQSSERPFEFLIKAEDQDSEREPNWELAADAQLKPDLLFSAMSSPVWFIASAAALLLLDAVEHEIVGEGLKVVLQRGSGHALDIIPHIASKYWQDQTPWLLLDRLELRLTDDCTSLVSKLGELHLDEAARQRASAVLANVLRRRNARMVAAAIESIEKLKLDSVLEQELRAAYSWWLIEGPLGPERSGPVPPNAADVLLKHLASSRKLSFEEAREAVLLSEQRRRSDVREVAIPALCELLADSPQLTAQTLKEVVKGVLPAGIIDELSRSHPKVCQQFVGDIIKLAESGEGDVKIACIRSLGDGWASFSVVEPILRGLVGEKSSSIRDEAVRALRMAGTHKF